MDARSAAQHLVFHIRNLEDFDLSTGLTSTYGHIGAVLSDAILQAGMNYRNVVAPRVERILREYPESKTTSAFLALLNRYGAEEILQWRHPEKPIRIRLLTEHLVCSGVESEQDLSEWLMVPENCQALLHLPGIGPKTIDYLKILVNIPAVAVDRHIRNFIFDAGIPQRKYDEIRLVVALAADLLKIPPRNLDHAIWKYMVDNK
jgi:hypothetical protein